MSMEEDTEQPSAAPTGAASVGVEGASKPIPHS